MSSRKIEEMTKRDSESMLIKLDPTQENGLEQTKVIQHFKQVQCDTISINDKKNPRIFRTVDKLPMTYYNQQRAWSTGQIFHK